MIGLDGRMLSPAAGRLVRRAVRAIVGVGVRYEGSPRNGTRGVLHGDAKPLLSDVVL